MHINDNSILGTFAEKYAEVRFAPASQKYPFNVEVPIAAVKELGSLAAGLRERLRYVGALAFVHLDHQTGEHARIVEYDASTDTIWYIHEDSNYSNDCTLERLQCRQVETIEHHVDGTVPGCGLFHVWIKGYVAPTD